MGALLAAMLPVGNVMAQTKTVQVTARTLDRVPLVSATIYGDTATGLTYFVDSANFDASYVGAISVDSMPYSTTLTIDPSADYSTASGTVDSATYAISVIVLRDANNKVYVLGNVSPANRALGVFQATNLMMGNTMDYTVSAQSNMMVYNALINNRFTRRELLQFATEIEGHPDNLAPVLFGGFTAALKEEDALLTASYPLSEKLRFLAVIPDFELSTAAARAVMLKEISVKAAVRNLSRTALLVDALGRGDVERIRLCMRDEIHQPFRLPLIPGSDAVLAEAEKEGAAACISGAGSTMLLIADSGADIERCRRSLSQAFPAWTFLSPEPDFKGLEIA